MRAGKAAFAVAATRAYARMGRAPRVRCARACARRAAVRVAAAAGGARGAVLKVCGRAQR